MLITKIRYLKIFLTALVIFFTVSIHTAHAAGEKAVVSHANALFHDPQSPVVGNANGDVIIVDFFDYQCSHCSELSQTLSALLKNDPNVKIVFKELPILGDESAFASKAALAAAKQNKYLPLHHRLMTQGIGQTQVLDSAKQVGLNTTKLKKDMESKAIDREISGNLALAQKLDINGTPTLILVKNVRNLNGQKIYVIPGALSQSEIEDILRKLRAS